MEADKLLALLDAQIRKARKRVLRCDAYYEGEQPLRYMAPALEAEIGDRITQLVINWPRLIADAYDERLDIEGFRYAGVDSGDEALWAMWQACDGDELSQQVHLEALINGRGYAIAGAGEDDDDAPVMTVEHPLQCAVRVDPRNRKVVDGLKRWKDEDGNDRATLYTANTTFQYIRRRGTGWAIDSQDDHEIGEPLITPLANRSRMLRPDGRSEFWDIIPLADAANKMATDMMISGEFHAMPRRWVVGMTEEDFVDEQGNQLSTWSKIAGRVWASEKGPKDVEYGQFQESDLAVFHNTLKLLAQMAAQLACLPQDYMSFTSDNPTSADAIRASESRLIKRAERKQRGFGGGWEAHMRKMLRIQTGQWDDKAKSLETVWRDAATPTIAQKADAIVKLATTMPPIIPLEFAREEMGYSSTQRQRMAEMDAAAARNDPVSALAAQFREPPANDDA